MDYPILKQGSTGNNVVVLQEALGGAGQDVSVDGRFGPGTKKAVEAFQREWHVPADGVVGEATWRALERALGYSLNLVPAPAAVVGGGAAQPAAGKASSVGGTTTRTALVGAAVLAGVGALGWAGWGWWKQRGGRKS